MSQKIVQEVVETIEHPLEDFFGIEPNTTEVVRYEQKTELVKAEEYDDKDSEIEQDFQEIYDKAISGFENLQETVEDIDPKYIARTLEVSNQLLNTALAAAAHKANLKKHKDNVAVNKSKIGPKTVNQTLIMDTNALIAQIKKAGAENVIEGQVTQIEESNESDTDGDEEE